jgi:hypothetical protein
MSFADLELLRQGVRLEPLLRAICCGGRFRPRYLP